MHINRSKPVEEKEFIVRNQTAGFRPNTIKEADRSIEVVGATESPCAVYDPARWEVVDEVLLMSGCKIPAGAKIPVTIEHGRGADAVIGSYREMHIDGKELVGRVFFSEASDAEPFYIKVKEGHLERFSITYSARDRESVYLAENETTVIEGIAYEGPLLITKSWQPKALGLVLFAADDRAKARAENHQPNEEIKAMDKRLRAFLERSGLDRDATEEQAWAFMAQLNVGRSAGDGEAGGSGDIDLERERAEARRIERERCDEISAMCERHQCPDLAKNLISREVDLDAARKAVLDHLQASGDKGPKHRGPATILVDERDKFRSAAGDALLIRGNLAAETPAAGAVDLAGYSLVELARHALRVANQKDGGQPLEMIGRALTTSDFPYILANVAQNSLFAGWEAADETWSIWCADGSVSDFKTHSSVRVGEAEGLDEIPDHGEYKYGKRSEAKEEYTIATYGKLFAVTRQTIINDDLGAITSDNFGRGEAAARKVGDVAYAVLTANTAMGDGLALFHATHKNLVANGSGAVPGVSTIAAGILAMGTQKDLAGLRRLNIRPEYLLAPKALEGAAEVFFRSNNFADSATVATDSSLAATRVNPYAGDYFTRVYEPRLDDNDAAAWFLAARKGRTVTVFFLNGNKTPYMETQQGWTVDGVEYKVRIDCGAKAMDFRGLYMNDGN